MGLVLVLLLVGGSGCWRDAERGVVDSGVGAEDAEIGDAFVDEEEELREAHVRWVDALPFALDEAEHFLVWGYDEAESDEYWFEATTHWIARAGEAVYHLGARTSVAFSWGETLYYVGEEEEPWLAVDCACARGSEGGGLAQGRCETEQPGWKPVLLAVAGRDAFARDEETWAESGAEEAEDAEAAERAERAEQAEQAESDAPVAAVERAEFGERRSSILVYGGNDDVLVAKVCEFAAQCDRRGERRCRLEPWHRGSSRQPSPAALRALGGVGVEPSRAADAAAEAIFADPERHPSRGEAELTAAWPSIGEQAWIMQYTAETCYVCGDTRWDTYTHSIQLSAADLCEDCPAPPTPDEPIMAAGRQLLSGAMPVGWSRVDGEHAARHLEAFLELPVRSRFEREEELRRMREEMVRRGPQGASRRPVEDEEVLGLGASALDRDLHGAVEIALEGLNDADLPDGSPPSVHSTETPPPRAVDAPVDDP